MDHLNVIDDILAEMNASVESMTDIRYFIPTTSNVLLKLVDGYDIGLGCMFENVWTSLETAAYKKGKLT